MSRAGVPDFRPLDFDRLWAGRDKVTAVERAILRESLASGRPSRILEVGAGVGRLSATLREGGREHAAVDVTPEFLARIPAGPPEASLRVAANVYHLPFAAASFPAAVMVRVFGFLSDPMAALREVRRVMLPGGWLVVSYNPRPSVATLVDDLKTGATRQTGGKMRSMTFTRAPSVPVQPSSFPAWSVTRREFRRLAHAAGFEWIEERPTGWEEYPVLRRLPIRCFVGFSHASARAGGAPTRFATLRRPGVAPELPPWTTVLACPICGAPIAFPRSTSEWRCPSGAHSGPVVDGVVDARWFGPSEAAGGSGTDALGRDRAAYMPSRIGTTNTR
jgi:ubiquinone/menaquinone biosynthesis C-methylase UbiE